MYIYVTCGTITDEMSHLWHWCITLVSEPEGEKNRPLLRSCSIQSAIFWWFSPIFCLFFLPLPLYKQLHQVKSVWCSAICPGHFLLFTAQFLLSRIPNFFPLSYNIGIIVHTSISHFCKQVLQKWVCPGYLMTCPQVHVEKQAKKTPPCSPGTKIQIHHRPRLRHQNRNLDCILIA